MNNSVDVTYLRSLLQYDPESGIFTWLPRNPKGFRDAGWNKRFAGTSAGTLKDGYTTIRINKIHFRAARLAWAYMTGEWPPENIDVDHKDLNRSNERWDNLRLANRSGNIANRRVRKDSISGCKGVQWNARIEKWQVKIRSQGRQIYLGIFDNLDEASAAYASAAAKHHGEFARAS